MVSRSVAVICLGVALGSAASGLDLPLASSFFEQTAPTSDGAWRTFGGSSGLVVTPDGFNVHQGRRVLRFRWSDDLHASGLDAEEPLESAGRLLDVSTGQSQQLRHARRLRASASGGVDVVYYFGARGLEIDVEAQPHAELPALYLDSLDADLTLSPSGGVLVEGRPLALQPVAYTQAVDGSTEHVRAEYRLQGRRLEFVVGAYDRSKKLVVDPVVTYASYFAGPGEDQAILLRELADGSLLVAGNTEGLSFSGGRVLNRGYEPFVPTHPRSPCFVARFEPAERRIRFLTYLTATGNRTIHCSSADVDAQDRILISGTTNDATALPDALNEFRGGLRRRDQFLLRIDADGRRIEHSTFLETDVNADRIFMRAGPGEAVYLGFACSSPCTVGSSSGERGDLLVALYDFSQREFVDDALLPQGGSARGMRYSPSGLLFVYGVSGPRLPVVRPLLPDGPSPDSWAGFITAFRADLGDIVHSTRIGGQGGGTSVETLSVDADGSLWIGGSAGYGAIPDLDFPTYEANASFPFVLHVAPGEPTWRHGLAHAVDSRVVSESGFLTGDGRYCLATTEFGLARPPGGAVVGDRAVLSCTDSTATSFERLTTIGSSLFTPSAASEDNAIWSLTTITHGPDAVPAELKTAALQPERPRGQRDDLVLRRIDLATPAPVLNRPLPFVIQALRGNASDEFEFSGENFAVDMELELDGRRVRLDVLSSFRARLSYESEMRLSAFRGLSLQPGRLEGRLVVPTSNGEVRSEPFPVEVHSQEPNPQPFIPTSDPRVLEIIEPVYRESEVLWNGQPIPLIPNDADEGFHVRIPDELVRPGPVEAVLRQPQPDGPVRRQPMFVSGDSIRLGSSAATPAKIVPGFNFAVDRERRILYVVSGAREPHWSIAAYTVPEGELIRGARIDKAESRVETVLSFELSAEGRFLYLLDLVDDQLRVRRVRTDSLAADLQVLVPPDARAGDRLDQDFHWRLRPSSDEPEAFAVATIAGRILVYDGDSPRPYSTGEFPARTLTTLAPLLLLADSLYAQEPDWLSTDPPSPCVVRYPLDAFGVGFPEEICDLDREWDGRRERIRTGGGFALTDQRELVPLGRSRFEARPEAGSNLIPARRGRPIGRGGLDGIRWHIEFRDAVDGGLRGRFPATALLRLRPNRATTVGDQALVYIEARGGFFEPLIYIVPNWRDHTEWYP